jgi:two-component system chemotaxis response regulator CheY
MPPYRHYAVNSQLQACFLREAAGSFLGGDQAEGRTPMARKILVIDDNPDTRDLTHLHLTTEGFVVVVASDSREGLYLAVAEQPDLIITDISMSELNGIDLVKQLSAQPELDNVPILVLTAFGDQEMDQAIRAGAHRAMGKPVHLDSLMDEVRQLLAESEPG